MTIGVDVGGTTVKGVRLSAAGEVLAAHRLPTPAAEPTGAAVTLAVRRVVDELGGGPAGVVVAGIVDEERGVAVRSVNLGLRDVPLRRLLAERLGAPVAFGHDVRAGALAEARIGAARGVPGTVAFVPVGTGLGAAVLAGGRALVSGGWAGEIGQLVVPAGPHAGLRVEQVASAAALTARAGADAREVAARVAVGDPLACALWSDLVEALADALAWLTAVTGPTAIVVGGGLAAAGPVLLEPLAAALHRRLGALRAPALVPARHGDLAAAVGAALLAGEPAAHA